MDVTTPGDRSFLYTVFTNLKGAIYIHQFSGRSFDEFVSRFNSVVFEELGVSIDNNDDDRPVAVEATSGVWCTSGLLENENEGYVIHIVRTESSIAM